VGVPFQRDHGIQLILALTVSASEEYLPPTLTLTMLAFEKISADLAVAPGCVIPIREPRIVSTEMFGDRHMPMAATGRNGT